MPKKGKTKPPSKSAPVSASLDTTLAGAVSLMMRTAPFLGHILYECRRIVTRSLDSVAAVTIRKTGPLLHIHPSFAKLSTRTAAAVLCHEMLHLVLLHPVRFGNRPVNDTQLDGAVKRILDHTIENIACDIVVDELLHSTIGADMRLLTDACEKELPGITLEKINGAVGIALLPRQAVEYYIRNLRNLHIESIECERGLLVTLTNREKQGQNNSNAGGFRILIDRHSAWADSEASPQAETIVFDLLRRARDRCGAGDLPAGLQRFFDARLPKKEPLWIKLIKRYLAKPNFGNTTEMSSYRRPARFETPPLVRPGRTVSGTGVLGIAIDTSGSMSDSDLAEVFSVVRSLSEVCEVHLVCCDADAGPVVEITPSDLSGKMISSKVRGSLVGSGGTLFDPAIRALARRTDPDVILYMTDGEGPMPLSPESRRVPVVWALSRNCSPQSWMSECSSWRHVSIGN